MTSYAHIKRLYHNAITMIVFKSKMNLRNIKLSSMVCIGMCKLHRFIIYENKFLKDLSKSANVDRVWMPICWAFFEWPICKGWIFYKNSSFVYDLDANFFGFFFVMISPDCFAFGTVDKCYIGGAGLIHKDLCKSCFRRTWCKSISFLNGNTHNKSLWNL